MKVNLSDYVYSQVSLQGPLPAVHRGKLLRHLHQRDVTSARALSPQLVMACRALMQSSELKAGGWAKSRGPEPTNPPSQEIFVLKPGIRIIELARPLASMEERMNDDFRAKAKALRLALEPFRDVRPVMSINRLIAFLRIAESEGKSITEYAQDAGVKNSLMVNELIRLSSRLINDQPGPDLLERRQDLHDPRIMAVNLTEKGRALLARSLAAVKE